MKTVNLGKKGLWYYIQLVLLTPFWFIFFPRDWKDQLIGDPELWKIIDKELKSQHLKPLSGDALGRYMKRRLPDTKRKPWAEFKNGLIKHNCKYDYNKLVTPNNTEFGHYECLHTGCTLVGVRHEDGVWVGLEKFGTGKYK